jgi:predicted transcriptional regulator
MQKRHRTLSKFLGSLELAVMEVVWKRGRASVRDVLAELNKQKRKFAYTTVMTVMQRLNDKGWLVADKSGRAFLYRAAFSGEEAEAQAVRKVVRSLLSDHGDVAIVQFMKEVDGITPEQLKKLRLLAQQKRKSGR